MSYFGRQKGVVIESSFSLYHKKAKIEEYFFGSSLTGQRINTAPGGLHNLLHEDKEL